MKPAAYDRVSAFVLAVVFGFSAGVAVSSWEWFPTEDWGDIASIPPTVVNYVALVLPWLTLLAYLIVRRRWIGNRIATDD
jgi:hypothetical protein